MFFLLFILLTTVALSWVVWEIVWGVFGLYESCKSPQVTKISLLKKLENKICGDLVKVGSFVGRMRKYHYEQWQDCVITLYRNSKTGKREAWAEGGKERQRINPDYAEHKLNQLKKKDKDVRSKSRPTVPANR